MIIKTFIVIHDQDILLDSIKYKKYDSMENLTFLFVGSGDISKIEEREDVIICRDLEHNIEQYKHLTSYTAWYAVWKNNLCDETIDYVTFLEYDCVLNKNYFQKLKNILNQKQDIDIVGYTQINIHNPLFIGDETQYSLYLKEGLKKVYNINIQEYIQKYSLNKKCSVVLNKTIKKNVFDDYMNWSIPVVDYFDKSSNLSGHSVERLITAYYLLNNLNHLFLLSSVINLEFNQSTYAINDGNKSEEYYEYIVGKKSSNIDIIRDGYTTYIVEK